MKSKAGKIIIIVLAAVLLIGAAIAIFCVKRHNDLYISKAEALEIAINDATESGAVIINSEVEFDKGNVTSIYDIELETSKGDLEYKINATTGEILSSKTDD